MGSGAYARLPVETHPNKSDVRAWCFARIRADQSKTKRSLSSSAQRDALGSLAKLWDISLSGVAHS